MNENKLNGTLIFIRHQESEWNKLGKWTGFTDIGLSEDGILKAREIGERIKDIKFDNIFISTLKRTKETLEGILSVRDNKEEYMKLLEASSEINERDYGDYTGKNKWEIEKEVGSEEFTKIRRGFDCPIPNGETLKMVYERSVPFFMNRILPLIKEGKTVLVVAHGNSIRALIKYIENISDNDISNVEMNFTDVIIYKLNNDGHMADKNVIIV